MMSVRLHLAQQVLEDGHDVTRMDGAVLVMEIQPALRRDGYLTNEQR
jgi:hypothetical protein